MRRLKRFKRFSLSVYYDGMLVRYHNGYHSVQTAKDKAGAYERMGLTCTIKEYTLTVSLPA